jgi:hypothetical protein
MRFRSSLFAAASASFFASTSPSFALDFDDVLVELWTGDGANEAMLIVDWQNDHTLAFGYRWDDLSSPTDLDLFEAVNGATDRLYREWLDDHDFEIIFGIGWDADADGFAKDDPDDWYEEGWFDNGFWSQWQSADGEAWDWGGGLGTIDLTHGAWVGWSWAPDFDSTPPDVPLIPAPATWTTFGVMFFAQRRRRKQHQR